MAGPSVEVIEYRYYTRHYFESYIHMYKDIDLSSKQQECWRTINVWYVTDGMYRWYYCCTWYVTSRCYILSEFFKFLEATRWYECTKYRWHLRAPLCILFIIPTATSTSRTLSKSRSVISHATQARTKPSSPLLLKCIITRLGCAHTRVLRVLLLYE